MAIVSFSIRSEVTEVEDDANRAGPGSETASGDAYYETSLSVFDWHIVNGQGIFMETCSLPVLDGVCVDLPY
jgi:hypothetical protein